MAPIHAAHTSFTPTVGIAALENALPHCRPASQMAALASRVSVAAPVRPATKAVLPRAAGRSSLRVVAQAQNSKVEFCQGSLATA